MKQINLLPMLNAATRVPAVDYGDAGLVSNIGEFDRNKFKIWNRKIWPVEYEIADVSLEQIQINRHITYLDDWFAVSDADPISVERFMNIYGVKDANEAEGGEDEDVDTWEEEEDFLKDTCFDLGSVKAHCGPRFVHPDFSLREFSIRRKCLRSAKPRCSVEKAVAAAVPMASSRHAMDGLRYCELEVNWMLIVQTEYGLRCFHGANANQNKSGCMYSVVKEP